MIEKVEVGNEVLGKLNNQEKMIQMAERREISPWLDAKLKELEKGSLWRMHKKGDKRWVS